MQVKMGTEFILQGLSHVSLGDHILKAGLWN